MLQGYGKGVKYALMIANLIILICGVVLLSMGIWTVTDRSLMERLFGAVGAYQEVRCLLKSYFIILFVLSAILSTVGGLGFTFRDQLDNRFQKELNQTMKFYGNDTYITDAWDSLQSNFHCCGIAMRGTRAFDSWRRESPRFNSTNEGPFVPESCCRSQEDDLSKRNCLSRNPRRDDIWTEGCYDKMKTAFKEHSLAIGLSTIFAVLFISFGLILSSTLYLIIRNNHSQAKGIVALGLNE